MPLWTRSGCGSAACSASSCPPAGAGRSLLEPVAPEAHLRRGLLDGLDRRQTRPVPGCDTSVPATYHSEVSNDTAVFGRLLTWVAPAREANWDSLYAEQLPRVYNFFRFRVGAGPVAEDLTSATFEKAWRARHRYRRDLGAFSTWLFTIARNVATDHFRQQRHHLPLEAAHEVAAPGTAADLAERRSDTAHLGRLVEGLGDRERELLSLKYGAGLTNRAIARLTGLSESNVGTLLHCTIGELRAQWDQANSAAPHAPLPVSSKPSERSL